MAEDRKSVYSIVSEFCRESAVLIFVFGNLDMWFRSFTELSKLAVFFGLTGLLLEKSRDR